MFGCPGPESIQCSALAQPRPIAYAIQSVFCFVADFPHAVELGFEGLLPESVALRSQCEEGVASSQAVCSKFDVDDADIHVGFKEHQPEGGHEGEEPQLHTGQLAQDVDRALGAVLEDLVVVGNRAAPGGLLGDGVSQADDQDTE